MGKFLGLIVRKDAVNSPGSPGGIAAHQVVSSIPLGEGITACPMKYFKKHLCILFHGARLSDSLSSIKIEEPCPFVLRDAFLNDKSLRIYGNTQNDPIPFKIIAWDKQIQYSFLSLESSNYRAL